MYSSFENGIKGSNTNLWKRDLFECGKVISALKNEGLGQGNI